MSSFCKRLGVRLPIIPMWAGQGAPLARALPAAELIARLEAETVQAIQQLLKGQFHAS